MFRQYLKAIFIGKAYKALLLVILLLTTILYYQGIPFNAKSNLFLTIRIDNPAFLTANSCWLLYYLLAAVLIFPVLEKLFLTTNPLLLIRNPSRKLVFILGAKLCLAFALVYNLIFFLVQYLASSTKADFSFILLLFISAFISTLAYLGLILMLALLFEKRVSYLAMVIWPFLALAFKSNYLILLTKIDNQIIIINLLWLLILGLAINYLNQKVETFK